MTFVKGVDVSSWNGDTVPDGLDFVGIKATQGTAYVNSKMAAQAASARAKGYVIVWYHFVEPGNIKAQAAWFVAQALSVAGDPLAADWEVVDQNGAAASCAEKDEFLAEVKRLRSSHKVGLYCNLDFWHNRDTTSDCGDFLWIADYESPAGSPRVQHPWTFHQYSSTPEDMDVANFPTRDALKAWATSAEAPKPVPSPPANSDHGSAVEGAVVIVQSTPVPAPAPEPQPIATYSMQVFADGTVKVVKQ